MGGMGRHGGRKMEPTVLEQQYKKAITLFANELWSGPSGTGVSTRVMGYTFQRHCITRECEMGIR